MIEVVFQGSGGETSYPKLCGIHDCEHNDWIPSIARHSGFVSLLNPFQKLNHSSICQLQKLHGLMEMSETRGGFNT